MWQRSSTLLALVFVITALMASAAMAYAPEGEELPCAERAPSPAPQVIELFFPTVTVQAESTAVSPNIPRCEPAK